MKTLDKLMKSGRLDKIWSGIDTELKGGNGTLVYSYGIHYVFVV